MTRDRRLDDLHRRVRVLARDLSQEGFTDEEIVDALLVVGCNGAARLIGRDAAGEAIREVLDNVLPRGGTDLRH